MLFPLLLKAAVLRQNALAEFVKIFFHSKAHFNGGGEELFVFGSFSLVCGCKNSADLEGEITLVADADKPLHKVVEGEVSEIGQKMCVSEPVVVVNVDAQNVASHYFQSLTLRRFLHVGVSRVPNGMEEGMIHKLNKLFKVGGVIDPVKIGNVHFVKVFD